MGTRPEHDRDWLPKNALQIDIDPQGNFVSEEVDRKNPPPGGGVSPPPGGFPIYNVSSSRTVSKRTPLEAPGTNSPRGVLLPTVLDEGT